jgi:hypothetical protein
MLTYNNSSTTNQVANKLMASFENSGQFKTGEVGNPNGRPRGSRNKRTVEVLELIKSAGHQDPLITLAELQAKSHDEGIRATAANMLAPYLHSKMGSTPVPPPPQYIEEAVSLPAPSTIRQAYENISRLAEMKALGKLDLATADSLINDQRVILNALVDEAKLIAAQGPTGDMTIRIEGGLPSLPGTNIAMPLANGHELPNPGSPLIDHQSQSPAQEPLTQPPKE